VEETCSVLPCKLGPIGRGRDETDWSWFRGRIILGFRRPMASAPLFKDGALGHEPRIPLLGICHQLLWKCESSRNQHRTGQDGRAGHGVLCPFDSFALILLILPYARR